MSAKKPTLEDVQKFYCRRSCYTCPFHTHYEHITDWMCILAVEPSRWDTEYIKEKINND